MRPSISTLTVLHSGSSDLSSFCLKSLLCGTRGFQSRPAVLSALSLPLSHSTRPQIPTNPAGFGSIKVDERLCCASAVSGQAL